MPDDLSSHHVWFSPADCAALLDATQQGKHWRAACPAHGGENTGSLAITEGRDTYGNPMTLLHCFAHDCTIQEICAAMGISVRNLFCIHPDYSRATRNAPRARSPRVERLRRRDTPATADDIAQILLEEMIVSDPEWIQHCQPARAKMWELAQDPQIRAVFLRALSVAHLNPTRFWESLTSEQTWSAQHGGTQ